MAIIEKNVSKLQYLRIMALLCPKKPEVQPIKPITGAILIKFFLQLYRTDKWSYGNTKMLPML
jgi:hypothetical protein